MQQTHWNVFFPVDILLPFDYHAGTVRIPELRLGICQQQPAQHWGARIPFQYQRSSWTGVLSGALEAASTLHTGNCRFRGCAHIIAGGGGGAQLHSAMALVRSVGETNCSLNSPLLLHHDCCHHHHHHHHCHSTITTTAATATLPPPGKQHPAPHLLAPLVAV